MNSEHQRVSLFFFSIHAENKSSYITAQAAVMNVLRDQSSCWKCRSEWMKAQWSVFLFFFFFCLCLLFICRSSWNLSIYLLLWWKWSEFPHWLTLWLVIKIFFLKICHQIKEIKWWKEYIKVKKTVVATNNVVHQEEEIFQLFLIHTEHLTVKNINVINISFICCCISPTWYKMDGFVDKKISFSV